MKGTVFLIAAFAVLLAVSCGKLDVVGNDSVRSFNELLHNAPQFCGKLPL